MKNYTTLKLILLLLSLIILWVISSMLNARLVWFLIFGAISAISIYKNKNVKIVDIVIGCSFGALAMPISLVYGVSSILIYLGAVSIIKTSSRKILVLKNESRKDVYISLFSMVLIGSILALINVKMALGMNNVHISFKMEWIFKGLLAGVSEEIIFRMFPFAICALLTNTQRISKFDNILIYLIMIVPHVLLHFSIANVNLASVIYLSIVYGLPFAVLQRNRDLVSAIGAHSLVDIIRFCLLGL